MSDSFAIKDALENPETLATVGHLIAFKTYGPEIYEWDPLTVYLELKADYNAEVAPEVLDRISAMQVVMLSDAFFTKLEAFLAICNTLADGSPFFQTFNPVTVEEAAWAITEISLNRELLPFSYAIKRYLKTILAQDGYTDSTMPEIFKEVLSDPTPDRKDVLALLDNDSDNRIAVEGYIDAQLEVLTHQFNQIPSLGSVQKLITATTLDDFVGNTTTPQEVFV
jgi:hypothetical protein